jgi:hypothetical protein
MQPRDRWKTLGWKLKKYSKRISLCITVESVVEKSAQVKTHVEEISGRFQKLEKSVRDENTA